MQTKPKKPAGSEVAARRSTDRIRASSYPRTKGDSHLCNVSVKQESDGGTRLNATESWLKQRGITVSFNVPLESLVSLVQTSVEKIIDDRAKLQIKLKAAQAQAAKLAEICVQLSDRLSRDGEHVRYTDFGIDKEGELYDDYEFLNLADELSEPRVEAHS